MAQMQRLMKVWADFEQTIVNNAIDQWSKQAFVKAKGQHFCSYAVVAMATTQMLLDQYQTL